MATGDITLIEQNEYLASGAAIARPVHVYGDVYAYTQKLGFKLECFTYSCDSAGDISASHIDNLVLQATTCYNASNMFKIAETVYGVLLRISSSYYVRTFTINNDGTFGGIITSQAVAQVRPLPLQATVINTSGTYYATVTAVQTSPPEHAMKTYSISADGTTISVADSYGIADLYYHSFHHLSGNNYVLFSIAESGSNYLFVSTWTIDGSGNISGIANSVVDSAVGARMCSAAHVSGDIWAVCYNRSSGVYYIRTMEISTDGTIVGSVDFSSAIDLAPHSLDLFNLGSDIFLYTGYYSNNTNVVKTFEIDEDGTIGSQLDSLTDLHPGGQLPLVNVVNGLFTGPHYAGDSKGYGVSLEVEVPSADRIYVWLGDEDDPLQTELTDPDYPTVMSVRTERGRDEELGHAASGICEMTCDNQNGDYSPENEDGEYYEELTLGKFVTVYEIYSGVRYNLFAGKIDKITPHPEPDDQTALVVAIDGMDDLAGSEIDTVLRTDTDSEELVEDILNAAGWSATARNIDSGVDTLQVAWYHNIMALQAIWGLEDSTRGFFFVDPEGNAVWQNRHYRVTGDRLTSQFTYNETMVKIGYEWSKRDVKNWVKVVGYTYIDPFYGLPEEEWIYYAPCNFISAPYIPSGETVVLWGELKGPRMASDTLIKGTHWNANTDFDKTGVDVSDDINLTITYYGQSIKFEIENTSEYGAFMVVPDTPPAGAPDDGTLLCYGTIYEELTMTLIKEDSESQDSYGKRTLTVDAKFKSNYYDVLSYADFLISRFKDPLPNPIMIKINAWDQYPDDTMKIEVLTRALSDRVTVVSSKLGVNQDYYVDKIVHEYLLYEGGKVHEVTMYLSRTLGQSEGIFWILGEVGFSELGETTTLGF